MNYVVAPYEINVDEHAEVGIWCSMPMALSTRPIEKKPPKIHVHVRNKTGEEKKVDQDFPAIAMLYSPKEKLFGTQDITTVNITPPAAFEFVTGLEAGRDMGCVSCTHCCYPHLDLGDFAITPHKKHFCANCGSDSTWSKEAIVSTPLKPLHDQFPQSSDYIEPDRSINMDDWKGCEYQIWASTPAVLWTANRPQEKGIHVHIYKEGKRVVDDTFSEVVHEGDRLNRSELFKLMASRIII